MAELGAVRALGDAGIPVDAVCGTSAGALVAATLARGWSVDRATAVLRENLVDRGTPLDLTVPVVSLASGQKMTDRIRFQAGDFLVDELDGKYDVVWLSHILHGEGPEDCQSIIRKAVGMLEPGGLIAIHEFVLDNSMDAPLFPALFSLNMLLGTPAGQAYSENQLSGMLAAAGVGQIQRIPVKTPNDSSILTGVFLDATSTL